jgi:hypothetical protein
VRLRSSGKALVELRPIGYQFGIAGRPPGGGADCTGESDAAWDDWLVIRGDVTDAGGRSWSFTDPCLTACEAEKLSAWLDAASRNAADQDAAIFTEPNISFFIDGHDENRVRMRICFSYESLPEWLGRDAPDWRTGEYFVSLDLSSADLAEAAQTWERERQAFPGR